MQECVAVGDGRSNGGPASLRDVPSAGAYEGAGRTDEPMSVVRHSQVKPA